MAAKKEHLGGGTHGWTPCVCTTTLKNSWRQQDSGHHGCPGPQRWHGTLLSDGLTAKSPCTSTRTFLDGKLHPRGGQPTAGRSTSTYFPRHCGQGTQLGSLEEKVQEQNQEEGPVMSPQPTSAALAAHQETGKVWPSRHKAVPGDSRGLRVLDTRCHQTATCRTKPGGERGTPAAPHQMKARVKASQLRDVTQGFPGKLSPRSPFARGWPDKQL